LIPDKKEEVFCGGISSRSGVQIPATSPFKTYKKYNSSLSRFEVYIRTHSMPASLMAMKDIALPSATPEDMEKYIEK
jgi:hypothetical protein